MTVLLIFSTSAAAENSGVREYQFEPVDVSRSRTVPLKIYYRPSPRPQPVILYSHGLGGSRADNGYLARHWAAGGYIAVFMQHAGSDEQVWKSAPREKRRETLFLAANVQNFLHRNRDVSFVIDTLEVWNRHQAHALNGSMDLSRIGMSGHSFGAVTTLSVAGQKFRGNRRFPEPRIHAFLAMSPSPSKQLSHEESFGHLHQPILLMTGTHDGSPVNPALMPAARLEVFKALPATDKFQLVLKGGTHFAFSDKPRYQNQRNPVHHRAIRAISLKFWEAYLGGAADAKSWLQSRAPIRETELVADDVWQWKDG
tara:strand:- start:3537 stop:4472 length:936 start_codon:yes stop_codon:yes gene_type:complete